MSIVPVDALIHVRVNVVLANVVDRETRKCCYDDALLSRATKPVGYRGGVYYIPHRLSHPAYLRVVSQYLAAICQQLLSTPLEYPGTELYPRRSWIDIMPATRPWRQPMSIQRHTTRLTSCHFNARSPITQV